MYLFVTKWHFYCFLDRGKWPTFKKLDDCKNVTSDNCDNCDKYTRCYEVTFPGDNDAKDYMLLEEVPGAFKTYQGRLKEEASGTIPVAFNDPDIDDKETEAGVSIWHINTKQIFSQSILC